MQVVREYPNGVFCWVDIGSTDIEGAKRFYEALFGWEAKDEPLPGGGFYTTFNLDGHRVAGGAQHNPDMLAQGVPSFWTSYVKHDDADAIAAKITEAGGTVMFPPMDIMDEGRMLIAGDPTGAAFGVWQPKNHTGAQLVNQPNTLSWNELQTRDTDGAMNFYSQVFGWTGNKDQTGYVTLSTNERRQAGMMAIDESWGEVPNIWAVYFTVDNIDAAAARVEELGGSLIMPVADAGDIGRFAVVQDPQGAIFHIIQFSIPADPPPGH